MSGCSKIGALAEFERDLIRERRPVGIAARTGGVSSAPNRTLATASLPYVNLVLTVERLCSDPVIDAPASIYSV